MSDVPKMGVVVATPISEVQPSETNPRRIPQRAVEVVAESLKRFGWQQPLVVDKAGVLVVGHTRFQAAKLLGLAEVPVVVAEHLTQAEVAAYRIADNRTHDFTTWNFPELVSQLDDLAADFSGVLALEDWATIKSEFDDLMADVPDDVKADVGLSGTELTVVFASKEESNAAGPLLMEIPGVIDVRLHR